MGNTTSDVTNNVKAQADAQDSKTYNLINVQGSGELVTLMKIANATKDYSKLDENIRNKVIGCLYNNGEGEYVNLSDVLTGFD